MSTFFQDAEERIENAIREQADAEFCNMRRAVVTAIRSRDYNGTVVTMAQIEKFLAPLQSVIDARVRARYLSAFTETVSEVASTAA